LPGDTVDAGLTYGHKQNVKEPKPGSATRSGGARQQRTWVAGAGARFRDLATSGNGIVGGSRFDRQSFEPKVATNSPDIVFERITGYDQAAPSPPSS
jgi:hypothetical protein